MIFYVNISEDGDGENVISSVTDYPIIDEFSYTLFWDTNKYGWITEETLEDTCGLILKNPSLLYNGCCSRNFDVLEVDSNMLEEIFGTSDIEEIENNIEWRKLKKLSEDDSIFPKDELWVDPRDQYASYEWYIKVKEGKPVHVGKSIRELLQFIKDNCYKG